MKTANLKPNLNHYFSSNGAMICISAMASESHLFILFILFTVFWNYHLKAKWSKYLNYKSELLSHSNIDNTEIFDTQTWTQKRRYDQEASPAYYNTPAISTVELQWLELLWDHENLFETGVVRPNGLIIDPGQEA